MTRQFTRLREARRWKGDSHLKEAIEALHRGVDLAGRRSEPRSADLARADHLAADVHEKEVVEDEHAHEERAADREAVGQAVDERVLVDHAARVVHDLLRLHDELAHGPHVGEDLDRRVGGRDGQGEVEVRFVHTGELAASKAHNRRA